jgi:hypothetical protein
MKLKLSQLRRIIKEELENESEVVYTNNWGAQFKVGDQVRLINDDPPSVISSETERWGSRYGMRSWNFDKGPKVTDNVWAFSEIRKIKSIKDVLNNGEFQVEVLRPGQDPKAPGDWFSLDQVEPA